MKATLLPLCLTALLASSDAVELARSEENSPLASAPSREGERMQYSAVLGRKGMEAFDQERFDDAVCFFQAALAMRSPTLWLEHLTPQPDVKLPADAMTHAQDQMERMLKDRPQMAQHRIRESPIYVWALRRFAGDVTGCLIKWDASDPTAEADHISPVRDQPGRVRLKKVPRDDNGELQPSVFEAQWHYLIFELFNLENTPRFAALDKQAREGTLTKEAYLEGKMKAEYDAYDKARAFYVTVFLPWARKVDYSSDARVWRMDQWGSLYDWESHFSDRTKYPWNPYGFYYDRVQADRLQKAGRYDEAIETLGALLTDLNCMKGLESGHDWYTYELNSRLATCCVATERYDRAASSYHAARMFAPDAVTRAQIDLGEASCLERLKQYDRAIRLFRLTTRRYHIRDIPEEMSMAYQGCARCLLASKRYAEGVTVCDEFFQRFPTEDQDPVMLKVRDSCEKQAKKMVGRAAEAR